MQIASNPTKKTRKHMKIKNKKIVSSLTMIASLGILSGSANAALSAWNTAGPAVGTDDTTGAGNFDWATTAAWADGTRADGVGVIASLEPRLAANANITVNNTYTVGEIYARNNAGDITSISGTGKLIFDNGASDSNLYMGRYNTRMSALRPSVAVALQLNSTLNIYMGAARQNETGVGQLGGVISGNGALNLNLGSNDTSNTRFFKLGIAGANSYAGGTFVQHAGQTTYGVLNAIQNSVQLDAYAGAFGTGNVTFNATGSDYTYATGIGAARGMWIRLQGADAIDTSATVNLTSAGNFAFDLNSKNQTVSSFVVDGVGLANGTYDKTSGISWLFDSGTGGKLIVVPEPSGAAMLGLLGFTMLLRRRR